jgi:hypothetical protein
MWAAGISALTLLMLFSLSWGVNRPVDREKSWQKVEPLGERRVFSIFIPSVISDRRMDFTDSKFSKIDLGQREDFKAKKVEGVSAEPTTIFRPVEVEFTGDLDLAAEQWFQAVSLFSQMNRENIFRLPRYEKKLPLPALKGFIRCSTTFGQDKIHVHVPPKPIPKKGREEPEFTSKYMPAFEVENSLGEVVGWVLCHSTTWKGGYEFIPRIQGLEFDPFQYGLWMEHYTQKPFQDELKDRLLFAEPGREVWDIAPSGYHNRAFLDKERDSWLTEGDYTDHGWQQCKCTRAWDEFFGVWHYAFNPSGQNWPPPACEWPGYTKPFASETEDVYSLKVNMQFLDDPTFLPPYYAGADPAGSVLPGLPEFAYRSYQDLLVAYRAVLLEYIDGVWTYEPTLLYSHNVQPSVWSSETNILTDYYTRYSTVRDSELFAAINKALVAYTENIENTTYEWAICYAAYAYPAATVNQDRNGYNIVSALVDGIQYPLSPGPEGILWYHHAPNTSVDTLMSDTNIRYYRVGTKTWVLAALIKSDMAQWSTPVEVRYLLIRPWADEPVQLEVAFPTFDKEVDSHQTYYGDEVQDIDLNIPMHYIENIRAGGEPVICKGRFRLVREDKWSTRQLEE